MSDALKEYFAALKRLQDRGEKITNDAVSIEAGRGKGTIKPSRPVFKDLIAAIDNAKKAEASEEDCLSASVKKLNDEVKDLNRRLNDSLGREISLIRQLRNLKVELREVRGGAVVPILGAAGKQAQKAK